MKMVTVPQGVVFVKGYFAGAVGVTSAMLVAAGAFFAGFLAFLAPPSLGFVHSG